MKKRFLSLLLLLLAAILTLTACNEGENNLTKLQTPTVVLEGDLATWEADPNADKFEISVDGALSYLENTVTSRRLTEGQSFKIRAVGDNAKFATSDWSNSVTYSTEATDPDSTTGAEPPTGESGGTETGEPPTGGSTETDTGEPPEEPSTAPTYLGILASSAAPSQTELPTFPDAVPTLYSSIVMGNLDSALASLLTDSSLALGDTLPPASSYPVYSTAGGTVYIQIWLDNPDQNTILSMKLGGTKYQSGGALQSFFIKSGNTYLNCVYVAVTVPQSTYGEITYQVTEIEYVEGNNVSQNGKAVLIDANRDKVTVGLTYRSGDLTVETATPPTPTASSVALSFTVAERENYLTKTGGWLRAVLLDRSNAIITQQKLTVGTNALSFTGLGAGQRYTVAVVLVADIHDGNGVSPHVIATESFTTAEAVTVEVDTATKLDEQSGKRYAVVTAEGTLSDSAFTFSKVEVYRYSISEENRVYSGAFTGAAEIREGILSDTDYAVRVYYKNAAGVEQYTESRVYTERLYMPTYTHEMEYGLLQHGIIGFRVSEDSPCNLDNLTLRIWREDSKQYIAKDVIYLLDNPTAIDDLQARLDSLDRFTNGEEFNEVYFELERLRGAQQQMENKYSTLTRSDWEALAEGSPYFYEIDLHEDDCVFTGPDGMVYVTLRGYRDLGGDDSCRFRIVADLDYNNGEPVDVERELCSGYFTIRPAIGKNDYLFVVSDENYDNLFTLDGNKLYLEVMSRNNLGDESYRALGYVNQIVLAKENSYDIVEVLWSQSSPDYEIDESAWLEDVIAALKAGEEPESAFPLGDLEPIEIEINPTTKAAGNYHIRFTYIMFGKTYTEEDPYDWDGAVVDYTVYAKLPAASVWIDTENVENYGSWEVLTPELVGGHWTDYAVEISDADGNLLHTYTQNDWDRARLLMNQKIRVRLLATESRPYYTDGEWSEWFVCEPLKLRTPTVYVGYEGNKLLVRWDPVDNAEKYRCTVNGSTQETTETFIEVPNGAKVCVVAVPAADSDFEQSNASEELTATDTRTKLATPNVTFEVDAEGVMVHVTWEAVEGAARYEVYNVTEDTVQRMLGASATSYVLKTSWGGSYRIKAIPANYDEYRDSDYSILISW